MPPTPFANYAMYLSVETAPRIKPIAPTVECRHVYLVVRFALVQHFIWGAMLLFNGDLLHTTAMDAAYGLFGTVFPVASFSDGALRSGVMYLLVAALAFASLNRRTRDDVRLLLLIPQQFILVLSAAGALQAMWLSSFADGVVRSREFIIADQCPIVILAALHTWALVNPPSIMKAIQARFHGA